MSSRGVVRVWQKLSDIIEPCEAREKKIYCIESIKTRESAAMVISNGSLLISQGNYNISFSLALLSRSSLSLSSLSLSSLSLSTLYHIIAGHTITQYCLKDEGLEEVGTISPDTGVIASMVTWGPWLCVAAGRGFSIYGSPSLSQTLSDEMNSDPKYHNGRIALLTSVRAGDQNFDLTDCTRMFVVTESDLLCCVVPEWIVVLNRELQVVRAMHIEATSAEGIEGFVKGKRLISVGRSGVRMWDLILSSSQEEDESENSGNPRHLLQRIGERYALHCVVWWQDRLFTGGDSGFIYVWV